MEDDVSKACIYTDGRCHVAFADGSALILHAGGQFSTYFNSGGEPIRQVTSCVPGSLKPKFHKAIQICNSYLFAPVAVFSDEVYKTVRKENKVTIIHWLNPGWISVIERETKNEIFSLQVDADREEVLILERAEDGSLIMKSVDDEAEISLNPNGLMLRIKFPLLLPHKKPE